MFCFGALVERHARTHARTHAMEDRGNLLSSLVPIAVASTVGAAGALLAQRFLFSAGDMTGGGMDATMAEEWPLEVSAVGAMVSCIGLAGWFVGSLYIWPEALRRDRNSSFVIKRRFISVAIVCVTAVLYLCLFTRQVRSHPSSAHLVENSYSNFCHRCRVASTRYLN